MCHPPGLSDNGYFNLYLFLNEQVRKDQVEIAIEDMDIIAKKGWFERPFVQDAHIRNGRESWVYTCGLKVSAVPSTKEYSAKGYASTRPLNPENGSWLISNVLFWWAFTGRGAQLQPKLGLLNLGSFLKEKPGLFQSLTAQLSEYWKGWFCASRQATDTPFIISNAISELTGIQSYGRTQQVVQGKAH